MGNRSPITSDQIRRSIEVEYWVVDEQGYLAAGDVLEGVCEGVEREFVKPIIEIKTTPCESTQELRDELFDRVETVLEEANEQGLKLVPLSTPINAEHVEDFDSERTAIQDRILGTDFEYVRHCAGTHIHVEQQPGNEIDQLNALTALDPALALVNSSPYYRGKRVAPGARSTLYRRLAYETLPNQGELWPYATDREEYARRVSRCYEEFVTEAVINGIDRERVETTFTAEGAVWTPVQFREQFSTVEWRSPDTALPSQILRLAEDIVSLVETAVELPVRIEGSSGGISEDELVLPTFESLREYANRAIREGLSPTVESYLDRMGFDVSAYDPISPKLTVTEPVSERTARELRLEYAERLESDMTKARTPPAE